MSLELQIDKLTAAIVDLTTKTDALINLRVEGLAKVEQAAAAPATKTTTKKAAEPAKAEEPAANISQTPEDRKDPANPEPEAAAPTGPTMADVQAAIQGYVTSGSPNPTDDADEITARKAEIFKLYDIIGSKMTPPREPGKTKLGDVPADKYSALSKRVGMLVDDLKAKGGRLTVKAAAAPADDDL